MSADFYSSLPVRERFVEIADPEVYSPVPDDWFVLTSDVHGSTDAIRNGRYKEVNTVGASTIVALLNVARAASPPVELPFVFGGDGAVVLAPTSLVEECKRALVAARNIARTIFDLDLRIGSVAVSDIRKAGHEVQIARFRISPHYDQAMFTGGGIAFAEKVLKDPDQSHSFSIPDSADPVGADFAGLECRWRDVPSSYGEVVTLIVAATTDSDQKDRLVYREVVEFLEETFAGMEQPMSPSRLALTNNPAHIRPMSGFAIGDKPVKRLFFELRTIIENMYFGVARQFGKKVRGLDPEEMVKTTIAATDHRKFDDVLRTVLSSSPELRKKLTGYLEERSAAGDLMYGMHLSDRALLTCVVFEQAGAQVHFVDGADGGYAMAALDLKNKAATA